MASACQAQLRSCYRKLASLNSVNLTVNNSELMAKRPSILNYFQPQAKQSRTDEDSESHTQQSSAVTPSIPESPAESYSDYSR